MAAVRGPRHQPRQHQAHRMAGPHVPHHQLPQHQVHSIATGQAKRKYQHLFCVLLMPSIFKQLCARCTYYTSLPPAGCETYAGWCCLISSVCVTRHFASPVGTQVQCHASAKVPPLLCMHDGLSAPSCLPQHAVDHQLMRMWAIAGTAEFCVTVHVCRLEHGRGSGCSCGGRLHSGGVKDEGQEDAQGGVPRPPKHMCTSFGPWFLQSGL